MRVAAILNGLLWALPDARRCESHDWKLRGMKTKAIGSRRYTYRIHCRHRQWLNGFIMEIRADNRTEADKDAQARADEMGARLEFLKEV